MTKPRVFIVRHGETAYNQPPEKVRGHIDLPLNLSGAGEALRLGREFKDKPIHKIYTSNLKRAVATAHAIHRLHPSHPPVFSRHQLRPWKAGHEIEGEEVAKVLPKMLSYQLDYPHRIPPGGHSFDQFKSTYLDELQDILDEAKQKPEFGAILVSAHTRNLRVTDGWMKAGQRGLEVDKSVLENADHLPTGSYLEYEHDGNAWQQVNSDK